MYRKEAALSGSSKLVLGQARPPEPTNSQQGADMDHFVCSGNGVFPVEPAVTLHNLHGASNPLCCALSREDTILATGGADSHLVLCQWGASLAPDPEAANKVVRSAIRTPCHAPVICTSFSPTDNLVAGGCMDGSLAVLTYSIVGLGGGLEIQPLQVSVKHAKYVKSMTWSPTGQPILATASADGTIALSKIQQGKMETMTTLHLPGPVETLCFSEDGKLLFCYTRGTPYLSSFNLEKNYEQTKINLNGGGGGGFVDHVSFAVMDMAVRGKYLALATDTSRNIIFHLDENRQVRNLYGHTNDGYSQPKLGFSQNGQYILGNTQDDASVCVWDIASTTIVKRLVGHGQPVRALYSSPHSDTLVTTSFDKKIMIWLA